MDGKARRIMAMLKLSRQRGQNLQKASPLTAKSTDININIDKLKQNFIEKLLSRFKGSSRTGRGGDLPSAPMFIYANNNTAVRSLFKNIIIPAGNDSGPSDNLPINAEDFEKAILQLLPGTSKSEIDALARSLDFDGNGSISVKEFSLFIENSLVQDNMEEAGFGGSTSASSSRRRSKQTNPAVVAAAAASSSYLPSKRKNTQIKSTAINNTYDDRSDSASIILGAEFDRFSITSSFCSTSGAEVSQDIFRLKFGEILPVFIHNLKNRVLCEGEKALSKLPHQQRLQAHRSEASVLLGKAILFEHFKRYAHPSVLPTSNQADEKLLCLEFRDLFQALSHYREQGQPFPTRATIQRLWQACSRGDVTTLIDSIIYAPPEKQEINQFGFQKVLFNPLQRTSPQVERGPFVYPDEKKATALKALEAANHDTTLSTGVQNVPLCPTKPEEMPQRIRYRYCRTAVQPPSNFDPSLIAASAKPPTSSLTLEHIYGYTTNVETIPGPNCYAALNGKAVVYAAAAVGIIHDVKSNRQRFLMGHTDDISALAVDGNGPIAATGQMGKRPFVCVWDLEQASLVGKLGETFFARLVCCISISPDSKKLAAVSGDDHHMLGIWSLTTMSLEVEMKAQNGPPPQVMSIEWLPDQGGCQQQLVTVGANHVKVWALTYEPPSGTRVSNDNAKHLRRASLMSTSALLQSSSTSANRRSSTASATSSSAAPTGPKASLASRAAVYGKASKQTRLTQCVAVMASDQLIVTGGDNGYIYLWKQLSSSTKAGGSVTSSYTCILSFYAHRGGVKALLPDPSRWLISGGSDGQLKKWDLSSILAKSSSSSSDRIEPTQAWDVCRPPSTGITLTTHVEARTSPFPKDPYFKSIMSQIREQNQVKISSLRRLKGDIVVIGLESSRLVTLDLRSSAVALEKEIQQGHHANLQGLAVHPLLPWTFATAGEDGCLFIIDGVKRSVVSRTLLPARARSLAFSPNGEHLAVGFDGGAFGVYEVGKATEGRSSNSSSSSLREIKRRWDCKEAIDELKYSPNGKLLAVGSHDNYIDLYETQGYERRQRLKGHTSYITHLDWSSDSKVIQSNCGAYEIIYWDAKTGNMLRSTRDSVEANTDWKTWTSVLGFPVMGIWPRASDGTDVNSVDRSKDQKLLVTADDFGRVSLFHYPVVVEHAPANVALGHSSHVTNVRFTSGEDRVISVGGHDYATFQWRVRKGDATSLAMLPSSSSSFAASSSTSATFVSRYDRGRGNSANSSSHSIGRILSSASSSSSSSSASRNERSYRSTSSSSSSHPIRRNSIARRPSR